MTLATDLVAGLIADASPMAGLRRRSAVTRRTVIFAEGEDERVVAAAIAMVELGLIRPLLIGRADRVRELVGAQGADPGAVEVVGAEALFERTRDHLLERYAHKGLQTVEAEELARSPLYAGATAVAVGRADAMVAGAVAPTSEVIRAGLRCVGRAPGVRTVSGALLMFPPDVGRPLLFADSAIVVHPDEDQLVDIGRASASTWQSLFGSPPRIAALSFSTRGSADHDLARRMAEVARRLAADGFAVDGELQVDAALVPEVAARKAPGSAISGRADVLLFPDLQAGNIGYKLVQWLGGWRAVGPLVQGFAKPVFDLSRGCTASDIVDTACIAALGVTP